MNNETGNEKKGLFARLTENKKNKKNSCCCNIELEEIPEEKSERVNNNTPNEKGEDSCCK